ncbi:hypothetical protein PMI14_01839 [Acidovorax sp. CF316]|uniref:hypothetical protein n=1 Tax=Acidovorax sp. CF316 TaxID=1144317 RepID=UPI00026BC6BD|nr:hypothetical protein [Acidovorax sp. CF316]EJE53465.1 hypothetical protein PMI14_01839 [Acidovorax sp. CF316]
MTAPCPHCGTTTIAFTPVEAQFEAVVRALANGSKTLAAGEFRYFAQCTDAEAAAWVAHLLHCAHAWPQAGADEAVLAQVEAAFAGVAKPDHFTDRTHCDECREHDDTLRARTRGTLRRQDLGNAGWDPITFSSADGIGYFFPALARFALLPDVWPQHSWYADQLVLHLAWDGSDNRLLAWCNPAQRSAVHALLAHLVATRGQAAVHHQFDEELQAALAAWQPPSA